jgi:A/G-specific adenine glycosylase
MSFSPSFSSQKKSRFSELLLHWYDAEQRSLPWRGETDPYRILVSEIMLQQTRVAVVRERYRKFLDQFPSVERLARAREQSVLAAWSGLGYYRRARALHAAAKHVTREGRFPQNAAALQELPGIGRYTASAIASIAFGEPVPVVDGNVKRVIQRISGRVLAEEEYWQIASELLDRSRPGDFNQAIMELGATVCVPGGEPLCLRCPIITLCASRGAGPEKIQKPRLKGELRYLLARRNGSVLLRQRTAKSSLMPGMWELPEIAAHSRPAEPIFELRHSITVTDYRVLVFAGAAARVRGGKWVPLNKAERLPLTGLTKKILRKISSTDELKLSP